MTETAVAAAAASAPATSEVRKAAGGAAALAFLLAVIDAFGGSNGGIVTVLVVCALVGVALAGVFLWAVPWALTLDDPGPSVVAVLASVLGLLTVVIFWSGLTPVFAAAGIVLGRSQTGAWEGRHYARAAVVVGVLAVVLDVVRILADVISI
ncbi:MAG TPA: hypothetical protein VFK76_05925 [Gaiellaceae bacterium]|nr:hypothetical protein [Gaiellaceae bacterium]